MAIIYVMQDLSRSTTINIDLLDNLEEAQEDLSNNLYNAFNEKTNGLTISIPVTDRVISAFYEQLGVVNGLAGSQTAVRHLQRVLDSIDPLIDIDFREIPFYYDDPDLLEPGPNITLVMHRPGSDTISRDGDVAGLGIVDKRPESHAGLAIYHRTNSVHKTKWLMTHELGHVLGLSHLKWGDGNQYGDTGSSTGAIYWTHSDMDSVMLKGWDGYLNVLVPGNGFTVNDKAALQKIWGQEENFESVVEQRVDPNGLQLFLETDATEPSYFIRDEVQRDPWAEFQPAIDPLYRGSEETYKFAYPRLRQSDGTFRRITPNYGDHPVLDAVETNVPGRSSNNNYNFILQKNSATGAIRSVEMDEDWYEINSGKGQFYQDGTEGWYELEELFKNDINKDGIIGTSLLDQIGGIADLVINGDGKYFASGVVGWFPILDRKGKPFEGSKTREIVAINVSGTDPKDPDFKKTKSTNEAIIKLKSRKRNVYFLQELDSDWQMVGRPMYLGKPGMKTFNAVETRFGQDFNNDYLIGDTSIQKYENDDHADLFQKS